MCSISAGACRNSMGNAIVVERTPFAVKHHTSERRGSQNRIFAIDDARIVRRIVGRSLEGLSHSYMFVWRSGAMRRVRVSKHLTVRIRTNANKKEPLSILRDAVIRGGKYPRKNYRPPRKIASSHGE